MQIKKWHSTLTVTAETVLWGWKVNSKGSQIFQYHSHIVSLTFPFLSNTDVIQVKYRHICLLMSFINIKNSKEFL